MCLTAQHPFATVNVMAEASAMRRLPDPDPVLGGDALPDEVFEQLLADTDERNGDAYRAIIEAEATWS
jgi:hypothetical protein